MCMVSAVFDYGHQKPWETWTPPAIQIFFDTVEKAKEFDEAAGEPDCEDPEKVKLLSRLEALQRKLKLLEEIEAIQAELDALEEPAP